VNKVRIKICGITNPDDAISAAELGADAIGLVFYKNSPRFVELSTARKIISVLPPFITKVGLFVDLDEDSIRSVLEKVSLDLLQFHGNESAQICRSFAKPYMKAVRMHDDVDLSDISDKYPDAAALLLDAYVESVAGGSGQQFDWNRIPPGFRRPVVLAGGLNPDNVTQAIRQVKPYAVDVSTGVESDKGIKDSAKMADFIKAVSDAWL